MFGSGDKHPFEQLLSAVPVSWEKALGLGLDFLFSKMDVDEVYLEEHPNGVSLRMRVDEEGIETVKEFWEGHVEPKL